LLFGWIPLNPSHAGKKKSWGGNLAIPREIYALPDGSLARRLPPRLRERLAELPWREVPGFPITSRPRAFGGTGTEGWRDIEAMGCLASSVLARLNLLDPSQVSTTFKLRIHPSIHDVDAFFFCYHSLADRDYVCVVVLLREASRFRVPAHSATNTRQLIRYDGFSVATSAKDDRSIRLAIDNALSCGKYVVRVVDRLVAVRSKICNCVPQRLQMDNETLFQLKPGVVRCNGDSHLR